ncbi:M14 family zinc carboxypeptidase [Thalassotalea agariperforans]
MKIKKLSFYTSPFIILLASLSSAAFAGENHPQKSLEKSLKSLSSYKEIKWHLRQIERWSRKDIQTGPLIVNGNNHGLIDIDATINPYLPINTGVCGEENLTPTIREGVICTVNDTLGGNTLPEQIGFSTQGRELLAARLGNPNGTRVMIITQQHGNEPAATEAAMNVLRWLSFSYRKSAKEILNKLDILMLIRANPDGGEPNARHCAITPATGEVLSQDCAMIRQNVNPHAGGGFAANSEAGFSGVVGFGYDLNRYHFIDLASPIRPVETQAMVATALAFQPEIVLDLHGDLHKTDCVIDYTSINPGQVLGQLPTANCLENESNHEQRLISPFADAVFSPEKEYLAHSLAVNVMNQIASRFNGSVGRFSQIQLGDDNLSDGAASNYQLIGAIHAGWETANFDTTLRADVIAVENFQPVIGVNSGLPAPELLRKQIRINQVALVEALTSLAEFSDNAPTDSNGFCDFPLTTGLKASLSPLMWGPAATNGDVIIPMSPMLGVPQIISGNCPN